MSSPNTLVTSGVKSGSIDTKKPTIFGQRRFISIGSKDPVSVNVLLMVPLSSETFAREACFRSLIRAIKDHASSYSPAELINTITTELPIDTAAALESAHNICKPILLLPYQTANLEPISFLTKDGNKIAVTADFETNRPQDLFYVSFDCLVNGASIDHRIKQPNLSLSFSLRLPQTSKASDGVAKVLFSQGGDNNESTTSPGTDVGGNVDVNALINDINKAADDDSTDKNALLATIQSALSKLSSSSKDSTKTPALQSTMSASPKMSKLLASPKDMVTSYFGPLDFADNNLTFSSVFGQQPTLLRVTKRANVTSGNSVEDADTVKKLLLQYFDRCKLDVFIDLCHSNYVGSESSLDETKAVSAIAKNITKLKMQYNAKPGLLRTIHPNDLYSKYLQFIPSLPDDPSIWNFVLCVTYYDALTEELKTKMSAEKFVMPMLHSLVTKDDHLNALLKVREAACTCYQNLQDENERIGKMIARHASAWSKHGKVMNISSTDADSTNPSSAPLLAYGSTRSQAETTLQKYSPSEHTAKQSVPVKTVTLTDGVVYPVDPDDPSIISDFPLGHDGCYACGQADHKQFKDVCPHRFEPGMKNKFWKNLWCHKPHTKKRRTSPSPDTKSNSGSNASIHQISELSQHLKSLEDKIATINNFQPRSGTPPKSILRSSPSDMSQVTWDTAVSVSTLVYTFH
jgi:hypothetical protein